MGSPYKTSTEGFAIAILADCGAYVKIGEFTMSNWKPIEIGIGRWQFETIKPSEVVTLAECQPRVDGTDDTLVAEYAADMQAYDAEYTEYDPKIYGWQKFPRLECVHVSDVGYILFSGFHRLAAIRSNDYTEIEVAFVEGTRQDAILLSKNVNADNGKRRTNADKAHVVKSCLLDDELKLWSDRQIAKWCGVAPNSVKNHESALRKLHSAYERPTRRKRLSNIGQIEWIDTAGIGNGTSIKKAKQEQTESERLAMQLDAVRNTAETARKSLWKTFDKAGLGTHISPSDFAIAAAKEMGWYDEKYEWGTPNHYLEGDYASCDKFSLKEADMWLARFNIIEAAIEHKTSWVQKLISVKPDLNPWEKAHQHAESVLLAFRNILKGLGVEDVDACLDGILLFYDGLAYADVKVATEAKLKQIASFYQPLLTQSVADWPEYIRENHHIPEAETGVDFDNFCDTIENLDQAWEAANLPISFEDEFLLAAAERTNFFPDTIKELYKAGKARQRHEEYEDYCSWNKTFKIILKGLQERSSWVEELIPKSDANDLPLDLYSEWKSDLLPQLFKIFETHGVRYVSVALDLSIKGDYGVPPWNLSTEQLEDLISESKTVIDHPEDIGAWRRYAWGERIEWAVSLMDEQKKLESSAETSDEKDAIAKLKARLKEFHVLDIEEFTDDILQFFEGVIQSELSTSSPETLKGISEFIESFVEQPLQAWPEYIQNSHHVPKRELVLVSIGISNNTDDEFEMVEFTDESSDEIGVALNELPAEIYEVLFKIAVEKIYANHVSELED